MLSRILLAASFTLLVASNGLAQFTYINPQRSISATGPVGGSTQSQSANNTLPFNQNVSSSNLGGTATAAQNSTFADFAINASGSANPGVGTFGGFGSALSSFSITFRCPANQSFTFAGNFSRATGLLSGPGVSTQLNGPSGGINISGTFIAGANYTLVLSTSGGTQGGQAVTGNFNFTLALTGTIPGPQTSAFTYQGILKGLSGGPLTGTADLEFRLFPAALGAFQVGPTVSANGVSVVNGVFTATLDFGHLFNGSERWLEIAVRSPAGVGDFTTISPRVKIATTPYASFAFFAESAAVAETASGAPWSGITGVPLNVSEAFSPWQVPQFESGIEYGGKVFIGSSGPREGVLNVDGALQFSAEKGGILFGASDDNGDKVTITRANVSAGITELRVTVGSNAPADFFTIGTSTSGFTPVFGFRMDGLASKPGGGSWAALSDPRAKHDITPLTGTLDRLLSLRGYEFFYNDDAIMAGKALPGRNIGLMADEVQRVFPNWIDRDKDGMLIVTERSTTALMVEALRDLRAEKDKQIEDLRKQVEEAARREADMEQRLKALEQRSR